MKQTLSSGQTIELRHFALKEFDSPDAPGSGRNMQASFLQQLDRARSESLVPFRISSGYRTPNHNKAVGGKSESAHMRGYAADIVASNSYERMQIVKALLSVGFNRIGVGRTFVHADADPSLPANVMWDYYTANA